MSKKTRKTAPFVPGSSTSRAAADSWTPALLGEKEERVYTEIESAGARGCTNDEIQRATGMRDSTVSARTRGLVKAGRIKDSGITRLTRSGRAATVWVLGTQDNVTPGPFQPVRPAKPSAAEFKEAVEWFDTRVVYPSFLTKVVDWLRAEGQA